MSQCLTIEIPLQHVKAVQDALVWACDSAEHEFDLSEDRVWSYKRYELALRLLEVEVWQTLKGVAK